jgi:hypothetical protein
MVAQGEPPRVTHMVPVGRRDRGGGQPIETPPQIDRLGGRRGCAPTPAASAWGCVYGVEHRQDRPQIRGLEPRGDPHPMAPDEVDFDRGPAPAVQVRQAHGTEAHSRRRAPRDPPRPPGDPRGAQPVAPREPSQSDSPMARQPRPQPAPRPRANTVGPPPPRCPSPSPSAPPLSPVLGRREHRARWCPAKTSFV